MSDDPVRPEATTDGVDWMRGLRLAALALASAVISATLVIVIGGAWLDRSTVHRSSLAADVPILSSTQP